MESPDEPVPPENAIAEQIAKMLLELDIVRRVGFGKIEITITHEVIQQIAIIRTFKPCQSS